MAITHEQYQSLAKALLMKSPVYLDILQRKAKTMLPPAAEIPDEDWLSVFDEEQAPEVLAAPEIEARSRVKAFRSEVENLFLNGVLTPGFLRRFLEEEQGDNMQVEGIVADKIDVQLLMMAIVRYLVPNIPINTTNSSSS